MGLKKTIDYIDEAWVYAIRSIFIDENSENSQHYESS